MLDFEVVRQYGVGFVIHLACSRDYAQFEGSTSETNWAVSVESENIQVFPEVSREQLSKQNKSYPCHLFLFKVIVYCMRLQAKSLNFKHSMMYQTHFVTRYWLLVNVMTNHKRTNETRQRGKSPGCKDTWSVGFHFARYCKLKPETSASFTHLAAKFSAKIHSKSRHHRQMWL